MKRLHQIRHKVILFWGVVFYLCISQVLIAQTSELLTVVSNEEAGLTSQQIAFINSLIAEGTYVSQTTVRINNLASLQNNGSLAFTIPNDTSTFTAKSSRVDYVNENDYSWAGKLENEYPGQILMIKKEYAIGGFIQTHNRFYTLMPMGGEYAVLLENDLYNPNIPDCGNRIEEDENSEGTEDTEYSCSDEPNNCRAVVDALVLITPEAQLWLDGLGQFQTGFGSIPVGNLWLAIGFESINIAFQNSDIPNKRVRTRVLNYNFSFGSIGYGNDITLLQNDPQVKSLRTQYEADIVIALGDRPSYGITAGVVAGSTLIPPSNNPEFDNGYSIIRVPFLIGPRFTYAHELGHIFLAQHSRDNDDRKICQHGFIFTDASGNEQRTLLGTTNAMNLGDPQTRILHYSNPNIFFNGVATGGSKENNANIIRNTACKVAVFQPAPDLSIDILGRGILCHTFQSESTPLVYNAYINAPNIGLPGAGPYTYEWRYNESGIFNAANPSVYLGNTNSISIISPFNCPGFFLYLKVVSSDGVTKIATQKVDASNCPECNTPNARYTSNSFIARGVDISPNPTQNTLQIRWTDNKPTLKIVDVLGNEQEIRFIESNEQQIILDVASYAEGIYIIQANFGNRISYTKLIKN